MCVVIFLIRSNNNLASKFLSGCNRMQIISSLCSSFINIKKKKKTGTELKTVLNLEKIKKQLSQAS